MDANKSQDDQNAADDAGTDAVTQDNSFYSDDVRAEALATDDADDDLLKEDKETPVTTGDMEIGDLDDDAEEGRGGPDSYDEEDVPGGEDVNDTDAD
jgi:hypothetical protein